MNAIILNTDDLRQTLSELSLEVSQAIITQLRSEMPVLRPVMTMAQLADYLQVSTQSIRNWIRRDKISNPLPFHAVGGDPRFHLNEINEWTAREAARQSNKRKKTSGELRENPTIFG